MTGSKMLVRLAVGLLGVCIFLVSGDSSAHPRANFKGAPYQSSSVEHPALESAPVSEVEYVDGPLAPLYGFLIQHRLQRFCKLLRDSGLEQVISDLGGSWTLFAPNDASFIFLPGGTLEELQRNPQLLRDFILYHFVVGDFPSTQIQNELMVDSVQGSSLRFNVYGQTTTVSGAEILEPDLLFEMGRVYIVDRPLYPIPSEDTITYLQRNHKEMYRLLVDLGLVDYLSSGTFTILAPDDESFDYLSVDLKDALATNISLAEQILLNHILPGSVYIGGITDGMQWETVGGSLVTFTIKRGLVFANGIPIVLPDMPLTNGVIHVLNRVILPDGIEAACQCKPSSDRSQAPGQVSGSPRPSFGQRPSHGQGATRSPGQSPSRQTPRPSGGQSPGTTGISGQRVPQGRPQSPVISPRQPESRPWSPSRTGQPVRPVPPANEVTRPPYTTHPSESLSDDDINSVVGTGDTRQRRPGQTRTTRYPSPPTPRQRLPPRPPSQGISSQTSRPAQGGAYPGLENENYPEQEVTPAVIHSTQTDRWSNRQRTPVPRYPTPQRGQYNTPTTRRPQTTRIYDWNQPRITQPPLEQPDQEAGIDSNQDQELQTQRPAIQTTSWQQRKQVTQTVRQPTQRTTFQPNRPQPPQRRTTVRPSGGRTTVLPPNEQSFEPSRQQPNCRRQGERITPFTQNLPICSQSDPDGCQNLPYDPTDPRPLCPDPQNQECRQPNERYVPSDNRPLCPSSVPENCRQLGQPTYIGDNRPLCTTSSPQTGCKDPSAPYNPSDRRPTCRTTSAPPILPPSTQDDNASLGCRRPNEVANPSDQRPVCPDEPQQDCRPFLERPKPGDRRPVCKVNRQPTQRPKPSKDSDKPQKKPEKPQQQTTYPQRGQYPTQTTRRQSWQSTTRTSQSWQSTTRAPQSWQSTTRAPQTWQSTTRAPQTWQSTTRAPQTWQSTTRAPQSWQSTTTRPPQSWQSTTRTPQSWQTTRQPVGKLPQSTTRPGSGSFQTHPQTDSRQTQSGSYPSAPESDSNPSQPSSGGYPAQPQPGFQPSRPQTGTHVSQPQSGRYPSQQSNRQSSQPQSGTHTTQPQTDAYPPQQQPGYPSPPASPQSGSYPSRVPPSSSSHSSQPQSGTYPSQQQGSPQSGSYPLQPQSGVQPSRPQPGSSRPSQPASGPGQSQHGRPTPSYPQRRPAVTQTQSTPSSLPHTQGVPQSGSGGSRPNQPFNPQQRPGSGQGQQTGSFATAPPRRPVTTTRIPISVTGTSTTPGEDSRRTLYEIVEDPALLIRGRPVQLTRIFELFHKAGIEDILTAPGPTTVFLPSDDAFALLPRGVVEQLEENPELLRQVLLYHVTNSEILPSPQPDSYTVPSLEGNQLVITMLNGGRLIFISGAKAVAVTRANNGIFYVINQLLYPLPHHDIVGAIQSRPDLSTLAFLLPLSGLEEMLRGQTPYTLLAPTDTAFAQLPQSVYDELTKNSTALQEILLNHIIEGAHYGREFFTGGTFPSARGGKLKFQVVSYGYQVNDINIKTPEIVTGTGVIHLIDQILLEDPDLQFFTNIENSVIGDGGLDINTQQPGVDSQQPGNGHVNRRPVGQRFQTNQGPGASQPQIGGLQPSVGQPAPVGRIPAHGQRIAGDQPGQPQRPSFGGQRQPVQPQQNPGSPPFGGRQPTAQGVRQPSQGQFQAPRQPSTQTGSQPQQQPGQPGHPSFGGQRTTTHGQRTQSFSSQRQPVTQTGSQTNSGGSQSQGPFQTGGQPNDVADLARSMGLNKFANWITNTGLLEKVHDGGVYTVFAPTDDAVSSLPQDMVYSIESNPEQVKPILEYHIVPQRLNLNSVTNEETASTLLQGKTIRFNVYPNSQPDCRQLVTASGTPVGEALATMGSIQVIPVTQVLYQPSGNLQKIIEASPILQRLNEAIKSSRLTWVLSGTGPMTIFAPSDTAFEALTEEQRKTLIDDKQAFSDLLKRHIVRGTYFSNGIQDDIEKRSENNKLMKMSLQEGVLTVNSVPVTYSDITATNGVLHVIDTFL